MDEGKAGATSGGRVDGAVVGLGASAGGLGALVAMLGRLSLDSASFVVVQHLSPDQESLLGGILDRATQLAVVTAQAGMPIEPNHVYVAPPHTDITLRDGVLQIAEPSPDQRPHLPIDTFFRSLADDCGARAIGIVLSGTGMDGTLGLGAIRAAGGLTFVQEPATAQFEGMPRSALESGMADFCLPPEAIADELMRLTAAPYWGPSPAPRPIGQEGLGRLFLLIRQAFGNDLGCYKQNTIERRVARRMALHRMERLDDYIALCQANPSELASLYRDVLINVTSFFRDSEPFEALHRVLLPTLLDRKRSGGSFRIWVPACATGEEAYSIAICLLELLEGRPTHDVKVQIFGTDVDEEAIEHARRGVYPQNIALDVSPERLARFFTRSGDEYQVNRIVRESIVFSTQNVLRDPPFSRLDLVSCRNLLIYLDPAAQRRVLQLFHYALEPHGLLLLGSSESTGEASDLFRLVDRSSKIYANKRTGTGAAVRSFEGGLDLGASAPARAPRHRARPMISLQQVADRKVLESYGPPGVVINEAMEVIQFRGRIGAYLEPASGAASFGLLRLARPDIHVELRRCVQRALKEDAPADAEAKIRGPGGSRVLRIEALPLRDPETQERCLLILFHELGSAGAPPQALPPAPPAGEASSAAEERTAELERELLVTREYLQTSVTELEAYNEELQCANEELQSTNEELQSTNEELETSKEELQSMNEELTTVNDELRHRLTELGVANDDLNNVLLGIDTAVILVGPDLRLRRFTHAAERLFGLGPGDVGRSVECLRSFVGARDLEPLCARVIRDLRPAEHEIQGADQRYYRLLVRPYLGSDQVVRGVTIALSDIDRQKRSADLLRDVGRYASDFLAAVPEPLLVLDGQLRVLWANEAFFEAFQAAREEIVGSPLANLGPGRWASPELQERLAKALASGAPFQGFALPSPVLGAGPRQVRLSGSRLPVMTGGPALLVSFALDGEGTP